MQEKWKQNGETKVTGDGKLGISSVHLVHLQTYILCLDTLTICIPAAAANKAPNTQSSDKPRDDDKRNHDSAASDFNTALHAVVVLDRGRAADFFEFARPRLEVEGADVVAEEVLRRIVVHARGAEVDVAVAEVRG